MSAQIYKPDNWRVGLVALKVQGADGLPTDLNVAGWVNGPFSLDACTFIDANEDLCSGFVLTHRATGYVVRQLHCGGAQAMEIVDEIAAGADWSFTAASNATALKSCSPVIKVVSDAYPNIVRSGHFSRALRPGA